LVQVISDGSYRPNPSADRFDVEGVVWELNAIKAKQAIQMKLGLCN